MIDKAKLRNTVLMSWGFTLMGVFNIIVLLFIASFLAMRVMGPEAFAVILMPALALMVLMFILGEVVINIIFQAQKPDPVRDRRFIKAVEKMTVRSRMWVKPRAWILSLNGKPNAMAYGPGFPLLCAVGISRELADMLDDAELEGVVAHEFAHIKCRDVGILAVVGFLLSLINKLQGALRSRKSMLLQSPVGYAIGWVLYGISKIALCISRFSISQERELAADALGASFVGDVAPLISGLTKLHEWSRTQPKKKGAADTCMFEDLMVSHPGLEERIASLRAIATHNKGAVS